MTVIKAIQGYRTSDNLFFEDKNLAQHHQAVVNLTGVITTFWNCDMPPVEIAKKLVGHPNLYIQYVNTPEEAPPDVKPEGT